MVCHYIIDYAEKFSKKTGIEIMVTKFDIKNHWKDGSFKKLVSQFEKIIENNKLYLIFQDELDGMLKERQDGDNIDVINEMNKFLDGEYLD